MKCCYVFFRCWECFAPDSDFPFEKFNDRPDDKINDDIESYMVNYRREHRSEFDKRVGDREKKLVAKLDIRAKQLTHRPAVPEELVPASSRPVSSFIPRRPRKLGPGPECSLGCRNAWALGWITTDLRMFGGWSPSPKCFLMRVDESGFAANIVEALTEWWPTSKCRVLYGHLNPRFGYVPASQFKRAVQAVIETGMDGLSAITPGDVREELQQLAAAKAMELGRPLSAADLPALSANASLVYELLLALPEYRAMTGPEIVSKFCQDHRINLDESVLRKSIVPALKPYGLEHVPKIGYRIKPSRRMTGQ